MVLFSIIAYLSLPLMVLAALYAVFLVALVYQSLLYGYFTIILLRYSSPCPTSTNASSLPEGVSVVVCAHNERTNLEKLLPLLLHQRFAPYEIIVADDSSTDGTQEFLASLSLKHSQVRTIRINERPPGIQSKKYALTEAIRAARYDKLLLTDADCRPASTDWVRLMTAPLQGSHQFVLGYSPYYREISWLNRFIQYETLHTGFLYTAAAVAGRPYMGVGRNLAYRKLFFMDKGGFTGHQTVVGGDDDLWVNQHATSSNTTVMLAADALAYSLPKTSWADYYYQKKRHLHVGQYYHWADQLWLGLLSSSTIALWTSGVVLCVLCNKCEGIVLLFLVRWLILAAAFSAARRQLHHPIKIGLLPILDFLHVMYYIVVGTLAFTTKNIRWTN